MQVDLGSDLVETYNSIKCLGMVQTSAKAGHLLAASRETADAGAASNKRQATSLTVKNKGL